MPRTCAMTVAGHTVTVHELTLNDQASWLAAQADRPLSVGEADETFLPDIAVSDLLAMVDGLTREDIGPLAPSDLAPVVAKARELNPHFFAMHDWRHRHRREFKEYVLTENLKRAMQDRPSEPLAPTADSAAPSATWPPLSPIAPSPPTPAPSTTPAPASGDSLPPSNPPPAPLPATGTA
ncbi:MAG: hypothetical protein HQL66_03265 [Magnetococcales bacterium]|nr:hypothetical protein [Magnetococcales bacterium]